MSTNWFTGHYQVLAEGTGGPVHLDVEVSVSTVNPSRIVKVHIDRRGPQESTIGDL